MSLLARFELVYAQPATQTIATDTVLLLRSADPFATDAPLLLVLSHSGWFYAAVSLTWILSLVSLLLRTMGLLSVEEFLAINACTFLVTVVWLFATTTLTRRELVRNVLGDNFDFWYDHYLCAILKWFNYPSFWCDAFFCCLERLLIFLDCS